MSAPAVLVLEDGRVFRGERYGASGQTLGEAVFCTAMTGYQETLTDPSYHGQIVVATAPQIGNTGWNDDDDESSRIQVAGYVVRDPSRVASNWRSRRSLDDALEDQGIVGLAGIDTRALVRHLRERGAMKAGLFSGDALAPDADLVERVRSGPSMVGADLYGAVTTPREYVVPADGETRFRVAALDVGIKSNTPRMFAARGVETHVLPADTPIERIEELAPDGFFLANGPGDPATADVPVALTAPGAGAPDPALRHLLRQPDPGPRAGAGHLQAALRPPGHQHPRDRARHRQGVDHRAEPRVRGRGQGGGAVRHPVRPGRDHAHLPERRLRGGPGAGGRPGVQRAVPPGGRGGPARRRRPLRPVRRA